MKTENEEKQDWKEVVVEIILKIITLGLYHVEKHRRKEWTKERVDEWKRKEVAQKSRFLLHFSYGEFVNYPSLEFIFGR